MRQICTAVGGPRPPIAPPPISLVKSRAKDPSHRSQKSSKSAPHKCQHFTSSLPVWKPKIKVSNNVVASSFSLGSTATLEMMQTQVSTKFTRRKVTSKSLASQKVPSILVMQAKKISTNPDQQKRFPRKATPETLKKHVST